MTHHHPLFFFAATGTLDEVQRMLALPDAGRTLEVLDHALLLAARGNHVDIVEVLLALSSQQGVNEAMFEAVRHGRLDVVRSLLKTVIPVASCHAALEQAAHVGRLDLVEALLPHAGTLNPWPLAKAAIVGKVDLFRALVPSSSLDKVVATLIRGHHWQAADLLARHTPLAQAWQEDIRDVAPPHEIPYLTALGEAQDLHAALPAILDLDTPVRHRI